MLSFAEVKNALVGASKDNGYTGKVGLRPALLTFHSGLSMSHNGALPILAHLSRR